jgi:F-type H+-transporting ATPase subunit delta
MSSESLANRYALALYELGKEKKKVQAYADDLKVVGESIEQQSFLEFLKNPKYTRDDKFKTLGEVYKSLSKETLNLLKLLVKFDRIEMVGTVIGCFQNLYNAEKNITEVTIVSAVKLEDDSKKALLEKLRKKYSGEVQLQETIDPSILGGLKLVIGDHVIDGSLRNSLNNLRKTLV